MRCSIVPARRAHIETLRHIERDAMPRFRSDLAQASCLIHTLSDPGILADAIGHNRVWLALDAQGSEVGYVRVGLHGGEVTIARLYVLPSHGQRVIGTLLLEHACRWAVESGYRSISLDPLAQALWDTAFYTQHGFEWMKSTVAGEAQIRSQRRERRGNVRLQQRVSMRRLLCPEPGGWTRWPAPAKLNLFLRLVGRRADGYHELQTVFRLLDRGDEVRLRVRRDGLVRCRTRVPGVRDTDNLLMRAATLLRRHGAVAAGVDMEVSKHIPLGGGLAGGSSNAATVLVALNVLWQTGLDEDALAALGGELGADVPVFVHGRSAWAEGVGERLTPLCLPRRWYVVLDPREQVSTAALFQAPELTRKALPATISSFISGRAMENAFEPVVRVRHPGVAAALDWLATFGRARLSGSGACVFLETVSRECAESVVRQCPAGCDAWVAAGISLSPLHEALNRHRGVIAA